MEVDITEKCKEFDLFWELSLFFGVDKITFEDDPSKLKYEHNGIWRFFGKEVELFVLDWDSNIDDNCPYILDLIATKNDFLSITHWHKDLENIVKKRLDEVRLFCMMFDDKETALKYWKGFEGFKKNKEIV